MKSCLYLAALFLFQICSAQEKLLYFNEDGKPVKEKQAVMLQQRLKVNDTLWEFNTYLINGPRITSMQFNDEKGNTLNGRYLAYSRKGDCDTIGEYRNGMREGNWHIYTAKFRVLKQLTYVRGKLTGKKDSTQLNEEGQKWRDSVWKGRTIVEIESEFAGGPTAWMQYLNTHMHYPQEAVKNNIQGNCVIGFVVDKDGRIDPAYTFVHRSVEYHIDEESLRIIRESPDWTPAVQDGKKVKSFKRQPFTFKMKG
jgi:periplasmic protein TonB